MICAVLSVFSCVRACIEDIVGPCWCATLVLTSTRDATAAKVAAAITSCQAHTPQALPSVGDRPKAGAPKARAGSETRWSKRAGGDYASRMLRKTNNGRGSMKTTGAVTCARGAAVHGTPEAIHKASNAYTNTGLRYPFSERSVQHHFLVAVLVVTVARCGGYRRLWRLVVAVVGTCRRRM